MASTKVWIVLENCVYYLKKKIFLSKYVSKQEHVSKPFSITNSFSITTPNHKTHPQNLYQKQLSESDTFSSATRAKRGCGRRGMCVCVENNAKGLKSWLLR